MIHSLTGKITHQSVDSAVIVCGGVGFKVMMPASAVAGLKVGSEATIFTYLNVKEDAFELFGFENEQQQRVFTMLISVSGVGPKVGIAILNSLSPTKITLAIAAADHKAFTAANGVGPKLAQRIVLELKDKATSMDIGEEGAVSVALPVAGGSAQALAALVALGYSRSEAVLAISGVDETLPTEEIIKLALKRFAK